MEYRLTVNKYELNPKYSPAQYPYSREQEQSQYLVNQDILIVSLTEEEFVAIKKAVIEIIK